MVFQNYALYPHMTVAENMGFALKMARVPKPQMRERVLEAARILDLEQYLDRKPRALSGGQRQRVAMGRAIVRNPQVFLMDEPLSNLDAQLRVQTRTQIAALQRRLGDNHDLRHPRPGRGDDDGRPRRRNVRRAPAAGRRAQRSLRATRSTRSSPRFIGSPAMNLHEVEVSRRSSGSRRIPRAARSRGIGKLTTPTDASSSASVPTPSKSASDDAGLRVDREVVEELGADAYVFASLPGHEDSQRRRGDRRPDRPPRGARQRRHPRPSRSATTNPCVLPGDGRAAELTLTFRLGGELEVRRLGFGAMRVVDDREEGVRVLRRAVELGVTLIDTADIYGAGGSEEMIAAGAPPVSRRISLSRRKAVSARVSRSGIRDGRPSTSARRSTQACAGSGSSGSICTSFTATTPKCRSRSRSARSTSCVRPGKIRLIGVSNVSRRAAAPGAVGARRSRRSRTSTTAGCSSRRTSLDACEADGLGFMPWSPLGEGLARPELTSCAGCSTARR